MRDNDGIPSEEEAQIDQMLHSQFGHALEGQLGRAEQAFRSRAHLMPQHASPRRLLWIAGGLVSAAAVVAVALLRPAPAVDRDGPTQIARDLSAADSETDVRVTTYWQTLDDGVVYAADDTPLRKLRKQQIQQVSWTDEGGKAQVQITIPVEQVLFAEYETF